MWGWIRHPFITIVTHIEIFIAIQPETFMNAVVAPMP